MIPPPNYEYEIKKLIAAYKKAFSDILIELERIDLTDFRRAQQLALLKSIGDILNELNENSTEWVETNLTKAASDGIARAIVELGVVSTLEEAIEILTFNRVNKELVKAVIADTQSDLLAVTQNVERKVRQAVRQVSAEVLRNNVARGINGTQSLQRDILKGLRATLGDSLNTGIIDAAGRRWKPTTYTEMLVRTKMMEAHKESTINEALSRGVQYGIISRHGATDACRNYEGKIVKFTPDAPGNYPYIGDLPRNEIFHPNCKHVVSPVRVPSRYE